MIDLKSLVRTDDAPKPPIITLYGTGKIGKTTLAASFPAPVFIRTEDGTDNLSVDAFPLATSFKDVKDAISALCGEHEFQTLVVDSLDWLEPLIWAEVAADNGANSINDESCKALTFGKGMALAGDKWRDDYLKAINYLRDHKGMTIIQIAHHQIKRFDAPDTDPYDRYGIKLHKTASALVAEDSDIIFFANYKTFTKEKDVGFNKNVTRALGNGQRVLHTQETPAWQAGNRYGMPEEIILELTGDGLCDISPIQKSIPFFSRKGKK